MRNSIPRAAAAGFLFLAALLAVTAAAVKKDIIISLERRDIQQMDASGLILVFFLQIANSERSDYALVEYDYRVVVQDADYFALRTALEEPIPVAREATTRISLPVRITYADLLERVPAVAGVPKASCYVTGQMVFADSRGRQEKIPFAFSGEFPLFLELEVAVRPLELKTLTIGGADFTVSFSLRNNNGFEIYLGRLSYRLDLEGRTIAEGTVASGKKIGSQDEIAFSSPHMLEFFEVGREVFDIMQKSAANGELSVKGRAESIWGDINVEANQRGEIQLVRTP